MPKTPIINQRYESKAQVERFKRAAKIKRWSLNTFMLEAAKIEADKVLASVEKAPAGPESFLEMQQ